MSARARSGALRVAIVGGSMGGLTAALLLRDLGHDVDVFERAGGELTGFGAGIVAHPVSLRYLAERTAIAVDDITVTVHAHRLLDGSGMLLWEDPVSYRFASWGSLYRALLAAFGRSRYRQGAALVGFGQDERGVDLRFAGGQQLRYDLLVLADGVQSTGRRQLFPGTEPSYAGYVAWRGTIAERDIPAAVRDRLVPNSHALVYPIPGADGRVDRGHRLWNFVWYRNVAKGTALEELMTDRDGDPHPVSLRPGRVQDRYARELRETAPPRPSPGTWLPWSQQPRSPSSRRSWMSPRRPWPSAGSASSATRPSRSAPTPPPARPRPPRTRGRSPRP
jgi:2,6-dihydroxypyridine 3-monooxygenase